MIHERLLTFNKKYAILYLNIYTFLYLCDIVYKVQYVHSQLKKTI